MFTKILIANRGEIACRVAATARRLGVKTVAVYSDADATARHVLACDEAVAIGGAAPKDSYLRADRILAAAKATGAQAVHPGYGFLSENAGFAKACAEAGIAFIGPPATAIAAMGSKSAAKALMGAAGVPLVPGYHGERQEAAFLREQADAIGYPVLIKASAGGGGKGMRRVERSADFDAALASCQRESQSSFGDAKVLIERYVTRPRHIEIQVFADTQGNCVYLFERDCSVQRRHQKVLEEAPAPGISAERRAEMGAAAVAAAKAVGYVGAGTVEFIAEPTPDGGDLSFHFMEMNTRLQVEHPVTEAISGVDLVEWQLRIACGEPLPMAQSDLKIRGHAIEARICAENPEAGFMPAIGRLDVARWPAHVAFCRNADAEPFHDPAPVRIDAGFGEGDDISPYYDSMIAKLIVWGDDRAQALARLDTALAQTHIVGLHTNVAFLRRVVGSRAFASADLDTALIEREHAALFEAPRLPLQCIVGGVVAHALAVGRAGETADPWSRADAWRLHGAAQRRFEIEVQGEHHRVTLERTHGATTWIVVGDARWPFATRQLDTDRHEITVDGRRWVVDVYASGEQLTVFAPEGSGIAHEVDLIAHAGDGAAEGGRLTAPMPGKVIAFLAKAGDAVTLGQPLAVMEAMKMEHTITAPRGGTIEALLYAPGDQVDEGGELLRLAPLQ